MFKVNQSVVIGLISDEMTILVINENGELEKKEVSEIEYERLKEVMRQPALLEQPNICVRYVMPEPGEVLIEDHKKGELEIMHVSVLEYNELKRLGYVRSIRHGFFAYIRNLMRIILGK